MAVIGYHSEMNEARPEAVIDAELAHSGGWFLTTPLTLSGRGVRLVKTFRSEDLVPQAQEKVGWNQYKVTDAAYERIAATHSVALEMLLS